MATIWHSNISRFGRSFTALTKNTFKLLLSIVLAGFASLGLFWTLPPSEHDPGPVTGVFIGPGTWNESYLSGTAFELLLNLHYDSNTFSDSNHCASANLCLWFESVSQPVNTLELRHRFQVLELENGTLTQPTGSVTLESDFRIKNCACYLCVSITELQILDISSLHRANYLGFYTVICIRLL